MASEQEFDKWLAGPPAAPRYEWAVRVTTEYWKDGTAWRPLVEVRQCRDEGEARARHEALTDYVAHAHPTAAKAQRITDVELIRRPVGEWGIVA